MPMQPGSPAAQMPPGEDALIRMIQELQRVVREDRAAAARAVAPWSARTDDGGIATGTQIIAGDPGGSRVELDSAGLRKYAADGTTVQVDLTGEVAAFSGLITGSEIIAGTAGAARVELDAAGLRVYAADGTTVLLDTADAATIRARGDNTALGLDAQKALTTGVGNTAVGIWAQRALTTGYNNAAVGAGAQEVLTAGTGNTAVGPQAQSYLTSGSNNTAVGREAQSRGSLGNGATETADSQTSIGMYSGQSSTTQVDGITTVGDHATAGAANATSIGREARADHAGSIALGYQALTTQPNQVMVGPRDVEITDTTKGLVLVSPDATRMRVTVADGGSLLVNGTDIGGGGGVGAPTDYTPVLTAATTNPTLGTGGSATGRYIQVGKLVTYWFNIAFGTSGAAAGSGAYAISLPVPAVLAVGTWNTLSSGGVVIRAAGLATQGHTTLRDATTLRLLYWTAAVNGTLVALAHNLPGAFTNGDSLRGYITYEAA